MNPSVKQQVLQKLDPDKYHEAAVVARALNTQILERLAYVKLKPETILEIHAHSNEMLTALSAKYKEARLYATTLSSVFSEALQKALPTVQAEVASAMHLPYADHSIDLLVANLALPWYEDMAAVFREFQRVLRQGGLLMMTALGPDTLQDVRESLQAEWVPDLVDMHHYGDALLKAQLSDPVVDVDWVSVRYQQSKRLQADLLSTGFLKAEPQDAMNLESGSVVQYEVIHAHAWGRGLKLAVPAGEDGVAEFPLAHLRRK